MGLIVEEKPQNPTTDDVDHGASSQALPRRRVEVGDSKAGQRLLHRGWFEGVSGLPTEY